MRRIFTFLLLTVALFGADVNRRAPGFALMDSRGKLQDLADYRGKLVLLEFTQTTCPHCAPVAEMLQKIQVKYGDRVAVLAVVVQPDPPGNVPAYVASHKLTYPILFDSGQMAYSYVMTPKLDFPHLYAIDGGGTIRKDWVYGPLTRDVFEGDKLEAEIEKLLAASGSPRK